MELVQRFKNNLYETFDIDLLHAIRLVVIVCGYIVLRQIAQRHFKQREIEKKMKEGKQKEEDEAFVEPEVEDEVTASTTSFGWGKKTRKRVKEQEKILEAKLEELKAAQIDEEDDKDIEDLLID